MYYSYGNSYCGVLIGFFFLFPSFLLHLLRIFCKEFLFILIHLLFIKSFNQCRIRILFRFLNYNAIRSLSFAHISSIENSFRLALCPFGMIMIPSSFFFFFLSSFLLSGTKQCSRLIMYSPCPSTRISHFSVVPWFLSLENSI